MNYLTTIFPYDIAENIVFFFTKHKKINNKWNRIFVRLTTNKNTIINLLHQYHDYARQISSIGYKYYDNNNMDTGAKLIKCSIHLHKLFSFLIQYSISLKSPFNWDWNMHTHPPCYSIPHRSNLLMTPWY